MGIRGPLPRAATMPATSPSEPLPAPAWLPDGARVVWEEIEPRLRLVGRTGPEWREILANYCVTAAELRRAGVALDSEPLTRDGPHGPVVHPLVSVVTKLRGTLAALGGKLGIDARAGGAAAMPLPDGLPLSKMEEWRRRHPA
jgi:P27 family predicted phage terminase small subunit